MSMMARTGWRLVLVGVAGTALLAACCPVPEALSDGPPDPAPDPLPLRRVLISPDRVPVELERARPGILVQLTRDEFEKKVDQARAAQMALRNPPRLVETRYRARLVENALVGESGEWRIVNPGAAGVLPLAPLNLALQKVALRKAGFDRREAVLVPLDGKHQGLLVDQAGESTAVFDWTARGDPRPEGLRFDLQVPPCLVANLEIDLPADRVLLPSRESYLLSGPFPGRDADRRLWRIEFSRKSQIDLVVRPAEGGTHAPPLVLASLQTRQDLEPDQVQADFRFDIELPRRGVGQFVLTCDDSLKPYAVNGRDLDGWEVRDVPPQAKGATAVRTLVVRFRELFQGGMLQVRCLAPLTPGQAWQCPGLHLAGALARDPETLELHIHPEVQLEDWNSGDFRLAGAAAEADGSQVLTLAGVSGGPAAPRRPSALVKGATPEFRTRQLDWWQVGAEESSLQSQVIYEMIRGRLFQLPLGLPADWKVEQVEIQPPALLRNWSVLPGVQGQRVLTIDLRHPLAPPAAPASKRSDTSGTEETTVPDPTASGPIAVLKVRLQSTRAGGIPAGQVVAFPRLEPLGAQFHQGAMAITVAPQFQAEVHPPLPAVLPEEKSPPWGVHAPAYYFRFQGSMPGRTLAVLPLRPRVRARCSSELVVTPGSAAAVTRLVLEPEVGSPDTLDLFVSPVISRPWTWRVENGPNRVRKIERFRVTLLASRLGALAARTPLETSAFLALRFQQSELRLWAAEAAGGLAGLAARDPLQAILFPAAAPRGEWWRLTLERPLSGPLTLQATLNVPGDGTALPFWPPESGGPPVAVLAVGPAGGEISPVAATTSGRTWAANLPPEPAAANASLVVSAEPGGRLTYDYSVRVWNWTKQTLPLRLPTGVQPQSVQVDGRSIAWLVPAQDEPQVFVLPVPGQGPDHRIQVTYAVQSVAWTLTVRLDSPVPELPVRVVGLRQTWRLPPGVVPLWSGQCHRLPGPEAAGKEGPALAGNDQFAADFMLPYHSGSGDPAGWTAWEADAGAEPTESMIVVRRDILSELGVALAILLAFAAWHLRRALRRLRILLLLGWLAATGLGLLWLPTSLRAVVEAPALAAGAVAVLWYGRSVWIRSVKRPAGKGHETRRGSPSSPLPVAVSAVLVAVGGAAGRVSLMKAATPIPATVFLVPGPAEAPEKQTVLVTPDLLARLQAMADKEVAGLREPVVLSAVYHGEVGGGGADFEGEFQVHSFADGPVGLVLPLGGVQLREAFLDGAMARPVAVRLPREGYTLELTGRGRHTVRLRFSVPASTSAEDHDIRFSIADVFQSRLRLDVPDGPRFLRAVACRGAQWVVPAAGIPSPGKLKGMHLEADLGRVGTLHVRWSGPAAPAKPPVVQVREAYLWTLRPFISDLAAVLQYTVKEGAATSLVLTLPEPLEVRGIGAGPLPQAATDEPAPRLKDWLITGAADHRRLELQFQQPVTRGVQITLDLLASLSPGSITLPVPTPEGVRAVEKGLLAYKAQGLTATVALNLRINSLKESVFCDFWRAAGMPEVSAPDIHSTTGWFGRDAGAPVLGLHLRPQAPRVDGALAVSWQLGKRQADLIAMARLTAPGHDLVLVEWEIPAALIIADLEGPALRSWSRNGSRLQAWLQAPRQDLSLRLVGWLPLKNGPVFSQFDLPVVSLPTVPGHPTFVSVAGNGGLVVNPSGLKNLWPLPESQSSDREYHYVAERAPYGGTFRVAPGGGGATIRVLTFAEVVDRTLAFRAALDYQVPELRTVIVRLRNWEGKDVQLEAPHLLLREERSDPTNRTWILKLPPGSGGHAPVRLTGTMRVGAAGQVVMPDVTVESPTAQGEEGAAPLRVERWVAVAGRELHVRDPRGLEPVADPARALAPWPAEAERTRRAGAAWKVKTNDWQLRLFPSFAGAGEAPVRVVLAEQSAAVADTRHWVHRAAYWLFHETATDLHIVLPNGATLLTTTIDGNDISPLQPVPGHLWLSLPGEGGARMLTLLWMFEDRPEPLDRPRLERPQLEGVNEEAALWTVAVPAGYRAAADEQIPAVRQDLVRAEAQLRLSAFLGERLGENDSTVLRIQLAAAQEAFQRYGRRAEESLSETAPTETLAKELKELNERNQHWARTYGYQQIRAQVRGDARQGDVEHAASSGALLSPHELPPWGRPTYWAPVAPGTIPRVRLIDVHQVRRNQLLAAGGGFLAVILALGIISNLPKAVALAQFFWPEEMMLLGILAWEAFGPGWVFAGLVFLGACGRLMTVGRWAFAPGRQPAPAGASSPGSAGSS